VRVEDGIQRSIVDYLEAVLAGVFVFAIPNAAIRNLGGRAGNAIPGLRKGMPDIGFLWNHGTFFLEVKTETGRLSADQIDCHVELRARGYPVATVCSIDEVRIALGLWGVITREAAA